MPDHERSTTAATLAAQPDPVRAALLEQTTAAQLTLSEDAPAYLTRSRRLLRPGLCARLTADRDAEHLL